LGREKIRVWDSYFFREKLMFGCGFWWLVGGEKSGKCGLLRVVFWVLAGLSFDKRGDGSTRVEGGGLGLGDDGAAADRSALAAGWGLGAGDAGAG